MSRTTASVRRRSANFTVAFLLIAAVVLADVLGVVECRSLQDNSSNGSIDGTDDYLADGAPASDDDEDLDVEPVSNDGIPPAILTTGLVIEAAEGTTVNLPCKVNDGSLDDVALIWINGTKSIMTDALITSTDPRVKAGIPIDKSDHTLVIEQVTRWDSGSYTCKITSSPPVEIMHTLHVTHRAKIVSVQSIGTSGTVNPANKKLIVKQGEPVQLVCNVVGYPTPTVQWTRKPKHHQVTHSTTPSSGQDQNSVSQQQSTATVVSNTNEVRIETVNAHQHAGYYECTAHNSFSSDPSAIARSGLDLEIEYQPEVTLHRHIVNTGETYSANLYCTVHSHPKPKVSWDKQTILNDASSWQPIAVDNPQSSRYEAFKVPANSTGLQGTGNGSSLPAGPNYALKVKRVEGQRDFGNYRCKAENKLGITYSEPILLTGTPAAPHSTYVNAKSSTVSPGEKLLELGWTVDSWSPLLKYQLQYRKQEGSPNSWTDVQPQPTVLDPINASNAGDERKYTMSYLFGGDGQQTASNVVQSPLQPGITYVARLRAYNANGWSEWSEDVVFSGGIYDDQEANEINHHGDHQHDDNNVLKAAAGSNGASGPQRSCSAVATMMAVLAATLATAVFVC